MRIRLAATTLSFLTALAWAVPTWAKEEKNPAEEILSSRTIQERLAKKKKSKTSRTGKVPPSAPGQTANAPGESNTSPSRAGNTLGTQGEPLPQAKPDPVK